MAVRLNVLRDEISVFAAADDDDHVMRSASRWEAAPFNAFNSAKWLAREMLAHRDFKDSLEAAKRQHLRASILVRIVLDRVRGRDVADLEAQLRGHRSEAGLNHTPIVPSWRDAVGTYVRDGRGSCSCSLPPRDRTRALWMAEDAARELPNLPLEDALELVYLYGERESPKYEKAALRWLERYLAEGSPRRQHFAEITGDLAKLESRDR